MPARLFRTILLLFALVAASLGGEAAQPAKAPLTALPEPMTRDAARGLVSELDDRQVRALLLKRLSDDAERTAASRSARDSRTLTDVFSDQAQALIVFIRDVLHKAPAIPTTIARTIETFRQQRGDRDILALFASLAASLAIGLTVAFAVRRAIVALHIPAWGRRPGILQRLVATAAIPISHLIQVIAFAAFAMLANHWLNLSAVSDRVTVSWGIAVLGWCALGFALVDLVLAPKAPDRRLATIDNGQARFLAWRFALVVVVFNVGFGFTTWLNRFGATYNETWIGFWVNLAFHLLLLVSIWQARSGVAQIAAGSTDAAVVRASPLARAWPYVVMSMIIVHWLWIEVLVATSDVPLGLFPAMAATLALLILLPMLDHILRDVVRNFVAIDAEQRPALQAAAASTREGLLRVGRVVGIAILVVGLLKVWNVDIVTLAEQGVGARFARSIINISLILAVAYGLWEVVRIVTDRHIAFEQVALGMDKTADAELEGEGGGAGARLGTLLPLVRLSAEITIVALTGLAILGEAGVNVWPLLAGAGVVGLAIGFGSQALVKDIISGVFFLIDDAFRKGEYIDIGNVKGTVERISLRSMQLRHHNGPLNTVPFGEIRHVTNFSRDWVVMKLSLRLTYDTDAEKVRKMIKKLGEALLADPEHGAKFLQPLKSQGVTEMDDSAMIMRVKFMTRPGDQWVIRRIVFNRIRDLFEKNAIRFASREVVVHFDSESSETRRQAIANAAAAAVAAQPARPPPA